MIASTVRRQILARPSPPCRSALAVGRSRRSTLYLALVLLSLRWVPKAHDLGAWRSFGTKSPHRPFHWASSVFLLQVEGLFTSGACGPP